MLPTSGMTSWCSSSVILFSVMFIVAAIVTVSSSSDVASVFTESLRALPYFSQQKKHAVF